jgi:hypothetical protein
MTGSNMNTILIKVIQVSSLLAVLLNAACGGGGGGTGTSKSFSNCYSNTNPGNSKNLFGNFAVSTDIWNLTAVTSYSECVNAAVDLNLNLGVKSARIDWTFVSTDSSKVKAYPDIAFGQAPGWTTSTTTKLPALVSSMPNLNVTGTINTTCATGVTCYFDSAFDLFFSNTATPTTWPPKSEMLIVTSYNFTYPLSALLPIVQIGGINFDVYTLTITDGAYSWPMIEYFAKTPITQLNLNIKDFVADALNRGVASTDYLDTVEIGTEVVLGQGSTTLANYNIQ